MKKKISKIGIGVFILICTYFFMNYDVYADKLVFNVKLIAYGTAKFQCPKNLSTTTDSEGGKCEGKVSYFELPEVNEKNFVGWSTKKDCSADVYSAKQGFYIGEDWTFYACFNKSSSTSSEDGEPIYSTRWVNYPVNNFKCSQPVFITTCTGSICNAYDVNTRASLGTINRTYLSVQYNAVSKACSSSNSISDTSVGDRYVTQNGDNYSCGDKLYITTCEGNEASTKKCKYTSVNGKNQSGEVYANILTFDRSSAQCSNQEETVEIKECNNERISDKEANGSYKICFKEGTSVDELKKDLQSLYVCESGIVDYKNISAIANSKNCDSKTKNCEEIYSLSCKYPKPTLEVTSGNVGSNGKGEIIVKGKTSNGRIEQFYYSESIEDAPTSTSNDWIDTDKNTFTIPHTPGTIYVWVKDSSGQISYTVSGSVLDNNNTKTTLRKLEFGDANGKITTPTSTTAYNDAIKSSNYVRLSNSLMDDSEMLADGFNPFDMEYKLEVDSPTVTVYATLTSTDSKYVDGYEPRTVNLNYGVNTVLIKIQDNEGKIRTYTILVTRVDNRVSDNTLNSLSVSVGEIEFNSNVTEYKVKIPSNTSNVEVKSTISSDKASYVSGYEPGNVSIKGDTTVKLIKVKSQTGSTRTYVITFVKENKDIITDETLQLRDLTIPGVYLPFEEEVANYSVSVEHETDVIDVNAILKDKNSRITFSSKRKSENEYVEGSNLGVPIEIGENFIEIKVTNSKNESSVYRITVIRKEYGLGISDDNTLKDLKVLGYDIDFEPNKKEYTVKIKQEKTLVITAVPNSNRAEVFIRGNEELTGFSTVRVKVVAENGNYETYSIDIKKDAFNKTIEIAAIVAGAVIILMSSCIIIIKKKAKANKEYFEE